MTKVLTLIFSLLLLVNTAAAQASGDHSTRVRIPNYIGLKIVDAAGNLGGGASVIFDYATDVNTYTNLVEAGGGTLSPTNVLAFEDIQVATRGGNWQIYTRTTFSSGFAASAGFTLNDVRVKRGSVSSLTPSSALRRLSNSWPLSTNWRRIARGRGATQGWDSLGFNGYDYTITIQGDEDPGEYVATVMYLLFYP